MPTQHRQTREWLHMQTAMMWATRSTCKRLGNGAVITNEDMTQILSFGYNGPGRRLPNDRCTGQEGGCQCVHAEANAVAKLMSRSGKIMFCTTSPCDQCAQLILNVGITRLYYMTVYRSSLGLLLLTQGGVDVRSWNVAMQLESM